MTDDSDRPYRNYVAVLTTMHGKEQVIAPVLKDGLGLIVCLAMGVNTDRFGTFSRDIERTGSQVDAARAKIAAGFDYAPLARAGLASEGSFGPHPFIPFLALGRELVVLIDRDTGPSVPMMMSAAMRTELSSQTAMAAQGSTTSASGNFN